MNLSTSWFARPSVAPVAVPGLVAAALTIACPRSASAHVKWFCAYNVAGQPRGLENVLCLDFEALTLLGVAGLLVGCLCESTPLGASLLRLLDGLTSQARKHTEKMIRAVCGFFFVSLWAKGGILLTPELTTNSAIIPLLQLAIAAGLTWRFTMPFSALGIIVLFCRAVWNYGSFHLMDYPIFLGIAAYLALTGLRLTAFGMRPLDVVRWSAGITLMWASIEKWAYPEWTLPLFVSHPAMSMGWSTELFMRAAGVIEFTLAFALLWTPLVRRLAAILLVFTFVSAILEFGKLDAIGHSAIIVVLIAIAADDGGRALPRPRLRSLVVAPAAGYCVALAGFLSAYYVSHAMLFGTAIL